MGLVFFFWVFGFPLPILVPPTSPHSSYIIRGWYNRPNSGRRTKWTQCHSTPISKNCAIISFCVLEIDLSKTFPHQDPFYIIRRCTLDIGVYETHFQLQYSNVAKYVCGKLQCILLNSKIIISWKECGISAIRLWRMSPETVITLQG
jgi:hypothetical protein